MTITFKSNIHPEPSVTYVSIYKNRLQDSLETQYIVVLIIARSTLHHIRKILTTNLLHTIKEKQREANFMSMEIRLFHSLPDYSQLHVLFLQIHSKRHTSLGKTKKAL